MIPSRRPSRQRGASIISMFFLAVILCCVLFLGLQIFPSVNEYLTIRKVVAQIMKGNPAGPADIRASFDKATQIEYSIHTIGPKDLDIQPLGDGFRTSYAYNVEIALFGPAYLLLKYSGSASSAGAKGP
jgi:hypothetical protein